MGNINVNPYFAFYAKINSKWIIDLNTKQKINFLEGNQNLENRCSHYYWNHRF